MFRPQVCLTFAAALHEEIIISARTSFFCFFPKESFHGSAMRASASRRLVIAVLFIIQVCVCACTQAREQGV